MHNDNKEEILSATLFLKTSDISLDATDTASSGIGYWTDRRARQTFRVNLRTLLGNEIYDKHNYFKLRLNNFTNVTTTGLTWSNNTGDYSSTLYLSGLNFINNTYWQPSQNNGAPYGAALGMVALTSTTVALSTYTEESCVVYFAKSTEEVDMTFTFVRIYADGGLVSSNFAAPTGVIPPCTFLMRIAGVSKEEEKYLI